jgi:hypothetical protein
VLRATKASSSKPQLLMALVKDWTKSDLTDFGHSFMTLSVRKACFDRTDCFDSGSSLTSLDKRARFMRRGRFDSLSRHLSAAVLLGGLGS